MAYFEGEVPVVSGNNCGNYGGGFLNGEGIWAVIVFAMIFGWGRNGWGGYGGSEGGSTVAYETNAAVQRGFDTAGITNKLNGLENGLCSGFYDVNTSLLNGFSGVNQTINTNGYETRSAINDLGYRLQNCCCETQRAIDGINFNLAKSTCDIIRAGQDNTQRLVDLYTGDKISSLQAENGLLRGQLSQNAQTNTIISALSPKAPVPSYSVFPPNMSYVYPTGVTFGINGNGSCGCGNTTSIM